jgi:hypothetical protein
LLARFGIGYRNQLRIEMIGVIDQIHCRNGKEK